MIMRANLVTSKCPAMRLVAMALVSCTDLGSVVIPFHHRLARRACGHAHSEMHADSKL